MSHKHLVVLSTYHCSEHEKNQDVTMCDQMYVNYGFQNKTERVQAKKKTHFKPMTKLENIAVIIDNPMVDNFANYGNLVHC